MGWGYNNYGQAESQTAEEPWANVVERYSYDVFGRPTIRDANGVILTTSGFGNRFMFTGREYDNETGLYYYRARFYNPHIGRFMQTDLIGYYDSMNLYQYVLNNPTNFVDPMGLDIWVAKHGLGGWHRSINVGNPNGSYSSYSYCLEGGNWRQTLNNFWNPFSDNFRTGVVYKDVGGGKIVKDKYLKTTPEQDAQAEAGLENAVGAQAGYDFLGNNCWGFSNEVFEALKKLFEGQNAQKTKCPKASN